MKKLWLGLALLSSLILHPFARAQGLVSDLSVQRTVLIYGTMSPAQLTANTNDWAPVDAGDAAITFAKVSNVRLTTDASRNLTGLAGGAAGRIVMLDNVGSFPLVLKNADTGSTAANRFALNADYTISAGTGVLLKYDGTSSRWRIVGSQGGGGGGGGSAADDTAYDATSWNANTDAPTKNVVRDQIETMLTSIAAKQTGDADLDYLAGFTPSANVKSVLNAADYAAIKTLLSLVIGTDVQAYDADLDYLATFTPTANVKSVLNAADYAAIRTLLGLVIGTNVQAYDADLTTYAGITPSANVQSVLSAADYAAIRTLLSLVIGTNVQAYDADLTTYAGITPSANVQSLLAAANYAAMRTALTLVVGTDVQAYDADLTYLAGFTPTANVKSILNAADYAAINTLLGTISLSANNAFTGQNTNTLRFRQAITTLSTGSQTLVANTDYTVAAMTSTLALTLPSGTAGDAIWIDLIGCNGTAAVTFASGIQRVGSATGTVTTITPPAGTQWLFLKYAGGVWKFSDSFAAERYAADAAGSDTYALTVPNYTAYAAGDSFTFYANTANTGGATLNVNSIGAGALYKASAGSVTTSLETGDILAGQKVQVVSDGTNWQVISRLASSQRGPVTEVTLTDGATITQTMVPGQVKQNAVVTLGGNRTLAFSQLAAGMEGSLRVIQDGTGSRTLTLPANSRVSGSVTTVTLLTAAAAENILSWYSPDGTQIRWTNGAF